MLKFVLDVGVGNKVWQYLTNEGYDAKLITLINPNMSDSDILAIAENEKRMVITMDKDFGELVYHSSKAHKGVLLLRLEDATLLNERFCAFYLASIRRKHCVSTSICSFFFEMTTNFKFETRFFVETQCLRLTNAK